ncbi:MT-A70-domain-containing protein, partial [Thozetella sp. PMI_491]
MGDSCILFQNASRTVVLLDLPRSIEEAQSPSPPGLKSQPVIRLRSENPPDRPFPTPEPRSGELPQPAPSALAQVIELMTSAAVEAALAELAASYRGPWCLPRRKRKASPVLLPDPSPEIFIPHGSQYFLGTIEAERARFLSKAPAFDLIILDPPWPNRSARRKRRGYRTADDLDAIRSLLSLIPVASHLSKDGLVAVWVTNAARFTEMLTSPRGLFADWGVELLDEWTWLKVTTGGEPIVAVNSLWRKPWERLLIARRRGSTWAAEAKGKVVVSVPELHSRKPNLRALFDQLLPPGYQALEVFARNLTSGWWSWGDEVLRFQHRDCW